MADSDSTLGKSPAFQFYAKDFTTGTLALSAEEVGSYIRFLCYQWDKGAIPSDLESLARIAGISLLRMRRVWTNLEEYFITNPTHPAQLINRRLERERQKQADYRQRQSDASHKRWDKRGTPPASTKPIPPDIPNVSSSVSGLQSSDFSGKTKSVVSTEPAEARSKRPMFKGQRFTVFEWMLDDLRRMLGSHYEPFDIHAWFFELDAKAEKADVLVPQRDGGKWLQEQTLLEAERRGLSIASTRQATGKTAGNVASAARFLARTEGR
jgi:uncharacterized protein YdaU (DUF1376 family)